MVQNRRKGERPGEESEAVCSELQSAMINDGLYFYEQVLRLFYLFHVALV